MGFFTSRRLRLLRVDGVVGNQQLVSLGSNLLIDAVAQADFFKLEQRSLVKRLLIAIPLFTIGFIVSKIDFQVLWRYFGWANQTTATVMLWVAAAYLYRYGKFHWVATVPAVFMTTVCSTFLFNAQIGFGLDYQLSVYLGFAFTAVTVVAFFGLLKPIAIGDPDSEPQV